MLTAAPVKNINTLTTHTFRKKVISSIYRTNGIHYISLDALTITSVVSKLLRIATTAG
jgi:hypothetical protein